jgi:dihydrofolate reductase
MRKVKYFVANSLDGFISRADGSVDWLFMDQDYGMSMFFASVDVAIMGRKTLRQDAGTCTRTDVLTNH